MRQIRFTMRRRTIDLLPSVLDPRRRRAEDALEGYRWRWQVERLFLDLKEVLHLHRFYLASPHGVAQQVYAAALVYVALRVAQAHIAPEHHLAPEELSPAKLFPYVARASVELVGADLYFRATQRVNPTVVLQKPDWSTLPHTQVALAALRVEHRRGKRRKRRYCPVVADGHRSCISRAHGANSLDGDVPKTWVWSCWRTPRATAAAPPTAAAEDGDLLLERRRVGDPRVVHLSAQRRPFPDERGVLPSIGPRPPRGAVGGHRAGGARTSGSRDRDAGGGVDLSSRTPQRLTEELAAWADIVVTMGCGDECPYIAGKRYVDWELVDPRGRPLPEVRRIRDDIQRRVRALIAELDS